MEEGLLSCYDWTAVPKWPLLVANLCPCLWQH